MKLQSTDNVGGAGVLKTVYTVDNSSKWLEYQNELIFNQNGSYAVKYRALDRVGNWENTKSANFSIRLPIVGSGSRGGSAKILPSLNTNIGNNTMQKPEPAAVINNPTNKQNEAVIQPNIVVPRVAGVEIVKNISIGDIINSVRESYNNGGIKKKFISDRLIEQLKWSQARVKYLAWVKKWCGKRPSCLNWVKLKQTRVLAAFQYEINIRRGKYIKEGDYQSLDLISKSYLNTLIAN